MAADISRGLSKLAHIMEAALRTVLKQEKVYDRVFMAEYSIYKTHVVDSGESLTSLTEKGFLKRAPVDFEGAAALLMLHDTKADIPEEEKGEAKRISEMSIAVVLRIYYMKALSECMNSYAHDEINKLEEIEEPTPAQEERISELDMSIGMFDVGAAEPLSAAADFIHKTLEKRSVQGLEKRKRGSGSRGSDGEFGCSFGETLVEFEFGDDF